MHTCMTIDDNLMIAVVGHSDLLSMCNMSCRFCFNVEFHQETWHLVYKLDNLLFQTCTALAMFPQTRSVLLNWMCSKCYQSSYKYRTFCFLSCTAVFQTRNDVTQERVKTVANSMFCIQVVLHFAYVLNRKWCHSTWKVTVLFGWLEA